MTRKESISRIHEQLVLRREALRKALAGDLSLLKKLREQSGSDVVDAASDTANSEINSKIAEVESREISSIDEAIARFKEGNFGKCTSCEKSIPLTRLNALPYATFCIDCQRAAEEATN